MVAGGIMGWGCGGSVWQPTVVAVHMCTTQRLRYRDPCRWSTREERTLSASIGHLIARFPVQATARADRCLLSHGRSHFWH